MLQEVHSCWRPLRDNDDIRVIVLTGAGDKAFCTGIDRAEQVGNGARPLSCSAPIRASCPRIRRFSSQVPGSRGAFANSFFTRHISYKAAVWTI